MHPLPRNTSLSRSVSGALATAVLLVMTACGSDDANRVAPGGDGAAAGTTSALPAPEGAVGSVTGMPANPGPGTSRITPVEPAPIESGPVDPAGSVQGAWAGDTYDGAYTEVDEVDGIEAMDVEPPIIIVPELPPDPVAIDIDPGAQDPAASPPQPTGTEAATESTTFVVESAGQDD